MLGVSSSPTAKAALLVFAAAASALLTLLLIGWQLKCCVSCSSSSSSNSSSRRPSWLGNNAAERRQLLVSLDSSAAATWPTSARSARRSLPAGVSMGRVAGGVAATAMMTRQGTAKGGSAAAQLPPDADVEGMSRFVFVYDVGHEFLDAVQDLKPSWYSLQYDAEKTLSELLIDSNVVRTTNPNEASLFFVPFFSARFTLFHYRDGSVNMREAVEKTSEMWAKVLRRIRFDFPYFNRTRGRDHFGILTMDHGRCTALTFLPPEMYGDMFFLQLNGDKLVRSVHSNANRNMQSLSYNYNIPVNNSFPDIPCYLPDRDIIIPPYVSNLPVVPPSPDRPIKVLFRFSPGQHHGVPIPHHGHEIRKEIYESFEAKNIPGWDFGVKSEQETNPDWPNAIFCICPPGHSQWTSRPFKGIVSGCIPITFFREHDNPFQDDVDYESFSVNIDPDDIPSLKDKIDHILASDETLKLLQMGVWAVQDKFVWTGSLEGGVEQMVLSRLRRKAAETTRKRRLLTY